MRSEFDAYGREDHHGEHGVHGGIEENNWIFYSVLSVFSVVNPDF
jgi:hypothetical protein